MNKTIIVVLIGIMFSLILVVPVNAMNDRPRPITEISDARHVSLNGEAQRSINAAPSINIGNNPVPRRDKSKKDVMKGNIPGLLPGTGDFGSYILNTSGEIRGIYAMQQINLTLDLPGIYEPTLYAPNVIPPHYAPLESVTAYWNYSGMASTGRAWGIWDHYAGGWVILRSMDSDFISNYVATYPEGQFYATEIIQDSNDLWNVLLYNFRLNSWDIQISSSSRSGYEFGWNMFETYFNGICPPLPRISSINTMVLDNGEWKLVTETYGSLLDYNNCANYIDEMTPFYNWSVSPAVINSINITYPDGGEILRRGRTYNITWSISGNTGPYVKIELLRGNSIDTLLTSRTGNNGIYSWKIPSDKRVGTNYRIRISSKSNSMYRDTSNRSFTITY